MANPGGVGAKFVSVNLNKSYGTSRGNSTYGQGRVRQGSHASGGGGMVVLSRPRSSQKAGTKLSVPPPLNLPSLRKEHEGFDLSGPGGGLAGSGSSACGSRPTSSGVGWMKPGPVGLLEKVGTGGLDRTSGGNAQAVDSVDQSKHPVDALTKGSATYTLPSARLGGFGESASISAPLSEKVSVLRGEDFPSLKAALPSNASGLVPKQKDGLHKREKNIAGEESSSDQTGRYHSSSLAQIRPREQSSSCTVGSGLNQNSGDSHGLGSSQMADQALNKDFLPVPLPLVQLNPRSEWADDERDTGTGFANRDRDHRFSKSEAYWEREFDMARNTVLPHKLAHNSFERWVKHGDEIGKPYLSEVPKVDLYHREVRTSGREGTFWRNSPQLKERFNVQEASNGKNIVARALGVSREIAKESKYVPPHFGDNSCDSDSSNRDSAFGRRHTGHGRDGMHQWNKTVESSVSRGTEWNAQDCHVHEQSNKYKDDVLQDSSGSKSSVSSASKVLPSNDSMPNFHLEKRAFSKSETIHSDEPFLKDFGTTNFDESDPFSGGLVGIFKRKKDVIKQDDFHDPVRESFEAELERVQKMQEEERQRIIEEQERAMEQARREEEERQRMIREEEEQQRRLEKEAGEAAWMAEQERLEAIRRAEEQKMAREEEKRRIFMEEERRKQAAKQKLLELETRMAKRQAEVTKADDLVAIADEKVSGLVMEKDVSMVVGLDSGDNWEDNERKVERVITSGSSDSSRMNRPSELGPRPHHSREGSSGLMDRGTPANSWRRDVFENGNISSFLVQEKDNGNHSLNQDVTAVGRAFPRKEFFGGGNYTSSRIYYRGGMQEPHREDFTPLKRHQWNTSGEGDSFSRKSEIDSELHKNLAERCGYAGWGQGHPLGNTHSLNAEQQYSEADELRSYGRLRYSMRQLRVLPPPLMSTQRPSYRRENELPGPSTFSDDIIPYHSASTSESILEKRYYVGQHEKFESSDIIDVQQGNIMTQGQEKRTTPRCDSQSSLSVSSPPTSPTHLSHEDLDESVGDSPILPASTAEKEIPLNENENIVLNNSSGKSDMMTQSVSISAADANDEDWALRKDETLQEQEEYDEDEDGFQEEDELHEGGDEHLDLSQELEDLRLEDGPSCMVDNLVLGFNEGVEVGIPDDEFERSSKNGDNILRMSEASVGIREEQGVGGTQGDGVHLQTFDNSSQMHIDNSSRRSKEIERAIQDSVDLPINTTDHSFSASDRLDSVDYFSSSGTIAQVPIPSSFDISHSSSSQIVMSTVPVGPSQAEVPVRLQFGLFSGPSLIPSPVPAIQIGSIQMPLHLHPPIGPSLTHMPPSQSPLFQFGQFRYTSPISQGILPMAPQSMSFVQPNVPAHYNLNQSSGGSLLNQPFQDNSVLNLAKDDVASASLNQKTTEGIAVLQNDCAGYSHVGDEKVMSQQGSLAEDKRHHDTEVKNNTPSSDVAVSVGRLQTGPSLSISNEKESRGLKVIGPQSATRGKGFSYSHRISGSRPSSMVFGVAPDANGSQRRPRRTIRRTEFRVQENADKRQSSGLLFSNNLGQDEKSNFSGSNEADFVKSWSKKELIVNKPLKLIAETEGSMSHFVGSQMTSSETMLGMKIEKESSSNTQSARCCREGNLKRDLCSEEDADAPLQTGIVCIFKQPGIETPSDEDDFIEVRSKRQMLNDRREQRARAIKAKTRITKAARKPRSSARNTLVFVTSDKGSASLSGEARSNARSSSVPSEGRGLLDVEVSVGFSTAVSQALAPIGTPAVNSDMQTDKTPHNVKSLQTGHAVMTNGGKHLGPGLMFEAKNNILENVQASGGPWGNGQFNKQVKTFKQTQLDDARKPGRFDSHGASIGEHTSSVVEPVMSSSSIMSKDKSFSCVASPINSLLAGERIQFGAVTSPTVLPEISSAVPHRIGAPGSCQSEIQISHNLSATQNGATLFFEKDKLQQEPCDPLEDCEAEAEAAASAVAVAAISSDETVGSALGATDFSISDSKNLNGGNTNGISRGVLDDQQLATQLRAEEPLSVSLPADLSFETPPISLWPPLPSPQNPSSQMLSHFPGGPHSHFPFYEMNPMLGGHMFAFGDESAGTQSQSETQKNTTSVSGPLGTWQQCHSGLESFYGPPSGFRGPYITPTGGMPGVQGHPHMLVYNHFPVGQFGQVGLSFMGPTYIQSGKQPDWDHNTTSSAMVMSEGSTSNINVVSAPQNHPGMAPSVQHLAPGSPLLPMASPLGMFDVAPFQSAPDMSVQGRWPHIPPSPLHSGPPSLPVQYQEAGVLPSQFGHVRAIDQSLTANRLSETPTPTPSDSSRSFLLATDSTATQFPSELGLADSSTPIDPGASKQNAEKSSTGGNIADVNKSNVVITKNNGQSMNVSKTGSSQQKNFTGYSYQRGGMSQKDCSGGDWPHRRIGFHGRNQSTGTEKNYLPPKMKQIYVAKHTVTRNSTVA
ncbi:hypothetical protein NMG60_11026064 [Bertholletia excelsa]